MRAGKAKNNYIFREDGATMSFSFCSTYIEAIGYDAQKALLEVRLAKNGRIRRYTDVPEEVWYRFRESPSPDIYYRRFICGHFQEMADCKAFYGRNKMALDKS